MYSVFVIYPTKHIQPRDRAPILASVVKDKLENKNANKDTDTEDEVDG